MIYSHQQEVIEYITAKLRTDTQVDALLISGSIAHGFNEASSDVDINIIVSGESYAQREKENTLLYWESAERFYEGGYIDGKYMALEHLNDIAKRGNEPTRFALHDAQIAFDRTGRVKDCLEKIGTYDTEQANARAVRFLSQLDAWKWYCEEASKKRDAYLLNMAVTKLILFAGRLILLDNRIFFPYHKWFMRVLQNAPNQPPELMPTIYRLLEDKSLENVTCLYELVKQHRDWTGGADYSWPLSFLHDVERVWMRQDEFIENL